MNFLQFNSTIISFFLLLFSCRNLICYAWIVWLFSVSSIAEETKPDPSINATTKNQNSSDAKKLLIPQEDSDEKNSNLILNSQAVSQEDVVEKIDSNKEDATISEQEVGEERNVIQEKIQKLIPQYEYDPIGKKDPFEKPGEIKDVSELPPEETIHPIEDQEINSIQLKAILWSNDGVIPRALFSAGGKHYTLSKNDRIGNNGSIIVRIDTDRVWYMTPFLLDPYTKQIQYKPGYKGLDPNIEKKQTELFFDR